jgi:hypothetical protein
VHYHVPFLQSITPARQLNDELGSSTIPYFDSAFVSIYQQKEFSGTCFVEDSPGSISIIRLVETPTAAAAAAE